MIIKVKYNIVMAVQLYKAGVAKNLKKIKKNYTHAIFLEAAKNNRS